MNQPELDQLIAEAKEAFSLQTEYAIDIAKDANKILEVRAKGDYSRVSHLPDELARKELSIAWHTFYMMKKAWKQSQLLSTQ